MDAKLQKFYNLALKCLAIRERCSFEINAKLLKAGASQKEAIVVIKHLEKENFLSNQRFAKAYCNDKFKYAGWGKQKIRNKLRMLNIDEDVIEYALSYIDDDEYLQKATRLAAQKLPFIRSKSIYEKNQKLMLFLYNKGFSTEICRKVATELVKTKC